MINSNEQVSKYLDELNHPKKNIIEELRSIFLSVKELSETIKWNAPNYAFNHQDIFTMKVYPLKVVQVILHRGSKVMKMSIEKPIKENYSFLSWRTNDRTIMSFKSIEDVRIYKDDSLKIINGWMDSIKSNNT